MSGKQKLVNQYWTARRNYRRIATKERIYNEDNTAPVQDRSESKRPSTRSTVSVKLTTNDNINDQRNGSKCQTTSDVINQQPEKATAESPLNSPGQKRKLQSSSLSNNTETKTKRQRKDDISGAAVEANSNKSTESKQDVSRSRGRLLASSTSKSIPAYKKYQNLITPEPADASLPIPSKFSDLYEIFHSIDTVVNLLHNRNEVCTFSKLKPAVQRLCKKNFDLKHLAQIKTVYPKAYVFEQERGLAKDKTQNTNTSSSYDLTINFGSEDASHGSQSTRGREIISKITVSTLIQRQTTFRDNLIRIVKDHHKKFLHNINPALSAITDIKRWHPSFKLDKVPDICEAELPSPPKVETYNTAKDVLKKARSFLQPKAISALEKLSRGKDINAETPIEDSYCSKNAGELADTNNDSRHLSKILKGVPQSLIDKIREKEVQNMKEQLTRSPSEQKKFEMLGRLPNICNIIKNHFLIERKIAMPVPAVCEKVSESYSPSLSADAVESHLRLLTEITTDWLFILSTSKGEYCKINKNSNIKDAIEKIQHHLNK